MLNCCSGNWTPADLQYSAGFHAYVDASHKKTELNFRGITGICIFCFGTWQYFAVTNSSEAKKRQGQECCWPVMYDM